MHRAGPVSAQVRSRPRVCMGGFAFGVPGPSFGVPEYFDGSELVRRAHVVLAAGVEHRRRRDGVRGPNRARCPVAPEAVRAGSPGPIRSGLRASSCAPFWNGCAQELTAADRPDADPMVRRPIVGLHDQVRYDVNVVVRAGCQRALAQPHEPLLFGTVRTWTLFEWPPVAWAQHFQPVRARDSSKELPARRHRKRQAGHAGTEEGDLDFRTVKTACPPAPGSQTAPGIG